MMFEPPSPKTKLPMSILCLFASRAVEIAQKQLQNSSHETSTPCEAATNHQSFISD
jgi:hypothetical protein